MAELSRLDNLDAETRAELDTIEQGTPDLERQLRAAQVAVDAEDKSSTVAEGDVSGADPDRLELRAAASIGRFLTMVGKTTGAERELQDELGLESNEIPMEMWERPRETRAADGEPETRAITPAPSTNTGVNLTPFQPMVFAPSIASRLMVEMPEVPSGAYATGTISTAVTADVKGANEEVPETAAAFSMQSTKAKRIGASLNLSITDIANVGQENFESILRQHISLVLSDDLDDQLLNGDGSGINLAGLFQQITGEHAAGAAVATFDDFVATFANRIDGKWATEMSQVSIVCGPETYRLSARTFRDRVISETDRAAAALGRNVIRGLRRGPHCGMVDKLTDAREGFPRSAGHCLPKGPLDDAQPGEAGCLPDVGRDHH